jgi:hypothetical protein
MGFFGLAAVPLVADRLRARKFIRAIAWSIAIAIVTSVYAWYQIPLMLWLGVEWFRWFASRSIRMARGGYHAAGRCLHLDCPTGLWGISPLADLVDLSRFESPCKRRSRGVIHG